MQAARLGISGILGVIIAFALFVLMSALIKMDDLGLDNKKAIKIADFTMPDTEIKENLEDELPDQPDEVEEPPPEVETQEIEFDSPDSGINLAEGAGEFKPDIGNEGGFARDTDMIPVYTPEARYPPRAQKAGKEGYAVVELTVTSLGTTKDIKLVEEWPDNLGFGRATVKIAAKLKYNPRVVNGEAVDVPGVLWKYTYKIAGGDKRRR